MSMKHKEEKIEAQLRDYFREEANHDYLLDLNDYGSRKIGVQVPFVENGGNHSKGLEPLDLHIGPEMWDEIIKSGWRTTDIADKILDDIMADDKKPHSRFKDLPNSATKSISELREYDCGKLVAVPAVVRTVGEKEQELQVGAYRCKICDGTFMEAENPENPLECKKCGKSKKKTAFEYLKERSEKKDVQRIKVQEPTEELERSTKPDTIIAVLEEDLVGEVQAGDRVLLNSVVDSKKISKDSRREKRILKVNCVEMEDQTFSNIDISSDDKKKIEELSKKDDIFGKLRATIAPDIYGYEKEKEAIVLQQFGGRRKKIDRSPKRGDLHILLIGDPGTAKSQLLKSISSLAPKSMYKSGKGASGAGLTAAAVRDEDMGGYVIKAGVLPLCDGGIACIDEIDKMSEGDREYMNDAMGSAQTIPVAKGGEEIDLKSRTAVLAAGNPKYGRFEMHEEVSSQIELHESLISRFDLIFPIMDRPQEDPEKDERTTEHMAEMHMHGEEKELGVIDDDLLRKYIACARKIEPSFEKSTMNEIIEFYNGLRKESVNTIKITPRQFDTLVRLSEASARMRLSEKVEFEDSDRAIDIFLYYLKRVATNASGKIDIDQTMTRYSKSSRTILATLKSVIEEKREVYECGVPEEEILNEATSRGLEREEARKELERMKTNGLIYEPEKGVYNLS